MVIFQIVYGSVDKEINECMDSVLKYYPKVKVYKFDKVDNPIFYSDFLRFQILTQTDDILYIDWDVILDGCFELEYNNFCSCEYYNGTPDYGIIYSPSKSFWIGLEQERIRRGISTSTYGWIRKLLRDKHVNTIKGNYRHLRYTSKGVE